MNNGKLNVLADWIGHEDLYYSLYSLFEKRLGMNLYRPMGEECPNPKWPTSFLTAGGTIGPGKSPPKLVDGVWHYPMAMGYTQKAISFEKFQDTKFDILVPTYHVNEPIFQSFVKEYQPQAKFIRQCCNIVELPQYSKNLLHGILTPVPTNLGINFINYHPEHHEEYCYEAPNNNNTICNFANYLTTYQDREVLWDKLIRSLPDFVLKMHGVNGRDGFLEHSTMPQAMKDSAFIWHIKTAGDGFVARQALSVGRPCIIRKKLSFLHHSLTTRLYKDGINCIDWDLRNHEDNVKIIRRWAEPEEHEKRCEIVAKEFQQDVNFEEEARCIGEWIEKVKPGI